MADDMEQMPAINPVVFDKPQFDAYTRVFEESGENASAILAREIASEVSQDAPEYFSYESLKDGTAKLFDADPNLKDLPPTKRALSDNDIISLFTVDTEGNPIEAGTFLEGFQREVAPQTGSFAGFVAGAKVGARAPVPHPVGKLATILTSGIAGAIAGYEGGSLITDELIGPEKPLLPGQRAAYEQGKTAAGVLGWLPLPFAISKNASLGTANYLKNLQGQVYGPIKPSRSIRASQFIERLTNKMGSSARAAPGAAIAGDTIAGAGAVVGAGMAETYFPDNPAARIAFEITGGVGFNIAGAPFTTFIENFGEIKPALKRVKETYDTGGVGALARPLKNARQRQAIDRIIEILEAEGEDVQAVIDRLAGDQVSSLLVDEAGRPIQLTAGAKAGSPALLAIEASLDQLGGTLGKERAAAAKDSIKALRNVIYAMAVTGDQQALQIAGDLAEDVFEAGLRNRLNEANDRVLKAFERVQRSPLLPEGQTAETNVQLSEKLYDIFTDQLKEARNKERKLWSDVPEVDITEFTNSAGETTNVPNFITNWKLLLGTTPELANEFAESMPRINQFVNRKSADLGLSGTMPVASGEIATAQRRAANARAKVVGTTYDERFDKIMAELAEADASQEDIIARLRQEASAQRGRFSTPRSKEFAAAMDAEADVLAIQLREASSDTADTVTNFVTSKELTDNRSIALDLAKKFEADGQINKARVAYSMADSMLRDLEGFGGTELRPDQYRVAYDMARAYSRALNDTFTRSIAGDAMATTRQGGDRLAPELLGKRLLQGGNDPTYLRLEQIKNIGNFAVEEGLPGAENTVGTLTEVTDQIFRNARAAAFDPETGKINPDSLKQWIANNKDVLDQFPRVRMDLENAQLSNQVLREDTHAVKIRRETVKNQLSFYDVMNPVIDPETGKRLGTENPTTAISRALAPANKTPIRDMNRLLQLVKNAPEETQESVMSGLKSSIFEWAATKAGITSSTFSPSTLYDQMFRPIKGSQNRIALAEWMLENGVANQAEISNLRNYITEMVKFEAAEQAGEIGELVERAGPILDFYLGITGSALGTRAQSIMTGGQSGPGALIAAGKGAETMRRIFADIPASLQTDVMSELMRNPELLAAMMRKPRGDKERARLAQRVGDALIKLGFISPTRRGVPGIIRETDKELEREEIPAAPPAPPVEEEALLNIPTQAPTLNVGPAPSPVQQASAAPVATPQPSGPVDRTRYAAMFPNDPASALIRQGIGSMMG